MTSSINPLRLRVWVLAICMTPAWASAESRPTGDGIGGQLLIGASSARFLGDDFHAADSTVRESDFRQRAFGFAIRFPLAQRWAWEAGLADFGAFEDRWSGKATSGLFNGWVYQFRYRARTAFSTLRFALWSSREASVEIGAGLAANEARNRFEKDGSRHIAPPLAPCPPPFEGGTECYRKFSDSPTFKSPGLHSSTRISPTVGGQAAYRFSDRASAIARYDHFGTFGRGGSVGRITVSTWAVGLQFDL